MLAKPVSRRADRAVAGQPVRIYDAVSGKRVFELQDPTGGTAAVAFSGDGQHIATADTDTAVRIYRAATLPHIPLRDWFLAVYFMAVSKDRLPAKHSNVFSPAEALETN
jgi:WD40 repeat protein